METARDSRQLEEWIERGEHVVAVHTRDPDAVLVNCRLLCRRSGRAMYHWSEGQGMVSLKAADISVPGCRKLGDAFRYVIQSMHYGVYIFSRFEKQLRHVTHELLRDMARLEDQRTIVFVGDDYQLPAILSERAQTLLDGEAEGRHLRPRLRDGRWVI